MAALSISDAWDETKARIASDGRLYLVVAAALLALPALVAGVIDPKASEGPRSMGSGILFLVVSLIAVVGQLALIRLAVGRSVSVGEAIGHGARRMPFYVVAGLLIAVALFIAAIPFVAVGIAGGVPMTGPGIVHSRLGLFLMLLFFALVCFIGIRMLMSSPVASEEGVGPIGILKRSWQLTAGHWWRLFGFLLLFLIGAAILVSAINWTIGSVAQMLLGPIEPMSASALIVAIVDAVVNAGITVLLAVMLARIYVQLSGREAIDVSVPSSGT
ncbi:MAG TPA: glycerophosphoryl diester phosphodiesterase membrane domain-containing protein [Sphingomicrobium sp.]|nr:glycerophosphoryl diester phosphodiesterase membrane domain-containing protein [Sphingomicrobium sp.]